MLFEPSPHPDQNSSSLDHSNGMCLLERPERSQSRPNALAFSFEAIPYVNGRPHVGHALEAVLADAYARFHRQAHDDVFFLSGSDENALKSIDKEVKDIVAEAQQFAQESPEPDPSELWTDVLVEA